MTTKDFTDIQYKLDQTNLERKIIEVLDKLDDAPDSLDLLSKLRILSLSLVSTNRTLRDLEGE